MAVTGTLALAGAGALGAGALAAALRSGLRVPLALQAAGAALLGVAGTLAFARGESDGGAFRSAVDPALGLDPLTGFFLLTLAVVAVPACVYADGYLRGSGSARRVATLGGLFVLALAGVLCARDTSTLLGFWELMTLVPAAAILAARNDRRVRRDVFAYVAITHVGGVGVWLAVLALHGAGAIGGPAVESSGGLGIFVALAAVIGFGTKAGLMPAHAWLPRAHPIAPSHVSAVMSGLMIKVALYGLIRVLFEWLDAPPEWAGALLLALGGLSAVAGVAYALFQHDLKRLLAFHSIENVGIIVLALGAAILFRAHGHEGWYRLAFAAALLHTLNHAIFKALLFLGAGAFERATHGLDVNRLGGLLRRMPWTGGTFLVGAMAIAGLPPLNGFASEWLTLQALLHLAAPGSGLGIAIAGLLGTALLALTAALAVFCFVKVSGLVLLGRPRRPACAEAVEAPWSMRLASIWLAVACVVLGAVPGVVLPELVALAPGGPGWLPDRQTGLDVPLTGSVGTLGLLLLVAGLTAVLLVARGRRVAATAPHWACGQRVEPALDWTSAGFTKTLRLALEATLRPHRRIDVRRHHGVVQSVVYEGEVPHLFDTALYRPVVRASLAIAARARVIQSGSLRLYVASLVGLVILVLVLARAGALG